MSLWEELILCDEMAFSRRLFHRVPTAGKMAQKNPCQGKHREFGNLTKTQGKHREFGLLKL